MGTDDIAKFSDLSAIFGKIIGLILGFAGIVLFILLIIGGFRFITSGGDPKAVDTAKKTISYAILGLVVILVSYVVLLIIQQITGINITDFSIMLRPRP